MRDGERNAQKRKIQMTVGDSVCEKESDSRDYGKAECFFFWREDFAGFVRAGPGQGAGQ